MKNNEPKPRYGATYDDLTRPHLVHALRTADEFKDVRIDLSTAKAGDAIACLSNARNFGVNKKWNPRRFLILNVDALPNTSEIVVVEAPSPSKDEAALAAYRENVANGRPWLTVGGKPSHWLSYFNLLPICKWEDVKDLSERLTEYVTKAREEDAAAITAYRTAQREAEAQERAQTPYGKIEAEFATLGYGARYIDTWANSDHLQDRIWEISMSDERAMAFLAWVCATEVV